MCHWRGAAKPVRDAFQMDGREYRFLDLLPESFYRQEVNSYFPPRVNRYGSPLDSRATCTKSDWLVWTATMAETRQDFQRMVAPLARFLRESPSRVAFSDGYDTVKGTYQQFIARSVQGRLYMPMLKDWK